MPSTVILGTGIIGLSTAYYLSQLAESDSDTTPTANNSSGREKHEIHLVEPAPELFASASGKAAGFLAKDWFAPPVAPLGEFSFGLHRKLAEEHGGRERWGWSESVSYSLDREEGEGSLESEDDDDEDEDEDEDEAEGRAGASERKKTRNDLNWLMSGSSRATLLDTQKTEAASDAAAAAEHGATPGEDDEEHPRWVRAAQGAMQMISDRTSTGQV